MTPSQYRCPTASSSRNSGVADTAAAVRPLRHRCQDLRTTMSSTSVHSPRAYLAISTRLVISASPSDAASTSGVMRRTRSLPFFKSDSHPCSANKTNRAAVIKSAVVPDCAGCRRSQICIKLLHSTAPGADQAALSGSFALQGAMSPAPSSSRPSWRSGYRALGQALSEKSEQLPSATTRNLPRLPAGAGIQAQGQFIATAVF